MINLKIKTLDSQNHDFSVEDEITVREFKELISEKVNVAANLQRLIYCGRVLNDDKPLKEYNVNGKVVHLVQRPPPSGNSNANTNDNPTPRLMRDRPITVGDFDNMMMGSFTIPVNIGAATPTTHNAASLGAVSVSSTLCMNRITVAKHMLKCADNIAAYLENPSVGLNNTAMDLLSQQTMESTVFEVGISAVTNADIPQHQVQNIVQAFQGAVSAAFRQNGISNITVQQSESVPGIQVFGTAPASNVNVVNGPGPSATASISIPINLEAPSSSSNESGSSSSSGSGSRQQTTSTQTLAEVVQQMKDVQNRLNPFIQQYYEILQNDPQFEDNDAAGRENAQRVFDRVSEALHFMAHAQHAISDLMLDLSSNNPRHLCCRPILVEQSAFVRSGISAVPQLNIGSFIQGSSNNNDMTGDAGNEATFPIGINFSSGQQQEPNNNNTSTNNNNTNNAQETGASNNERQQAATTRDRMERFLQSIVNSVQPNTEVHIINASATPPPPPSSGSAATATTTTGAPSTTPRLSTNLPEESSTTTPPTRPQIRTTPLTLPTTSTQTRSTARPQILTSTTLPPTSIRNLRAVPSNVLSSFDRFLPCNSHHIRENNQPQQTSQPPHRPSTSTRNARRTVSLDRNTGARSASSFNVGNTYNTLKGVSNITEEEYNQRFNLFGIQFTLRDIDNMTPGYFNGMRTDLRNYLINQYFDGINITDENMENGVLKIMTQLEKYTELLKNFTHSDYNIRASVENLLKKSLPALLSLINEDTSSEFGARIARQLMTFCENIYMVLVKCIGVKNAEMFLNDVTNKAIFGKIDGMGSLRRFPRHLIHTYLINRRSYDLSEIQEFLVINAPPPATEKKDETPMEVDGDESVEYEVEIETTQSEVGIKKSDNDSSENTESDVKMEASSNDQVPDSNVQENDITNDPLPIVVEGSEPWHAHFPREWLPIIARDTVRQINQTAQRPFSDTYISGMSSRRKKIYLNKKPTTDSQQFLSDGMRQAIHTVRRSVASSSTRTSATNNIPVEEIVTSIVSDPQVQSQYRDNVRMATNQRLSQDQDYSSEKFPNCKKFSQN